MTYRAPVGDMLHVMRHVAGLDRALADGLYGDLSLDLVETILDEAARFAGDVLAPLNRVGDTHGAPLRDGRVHMPPGFAEAYHAWTEAGWNALAARPITAARACRRCSTPPASRCGTAPAWPSASGRSSPWAASRRCTPTARRS
jgi:hypothetical protein